jgi:hypothetical protein
MTTGRINQIANLGETLKGLLLESKILRGKRGRKTPPKRRYLKLYPLLPLRIHAGHVFFLLFHNTKAGKM